MRGRTEPELSDMPYDELISCIAPVLGTMPCRMSLLAHVLRDLIPWLITDETAWSDRPFRRSALRHVANVRVALQGFVMKRLRVAVRRQPLKSPFGRRVLCPVRRSFPADRA
jgi:hypothetical protein